MTWVWHALNDLLRQAVFVAPGKSTRVATPSFGVPIEGADIIRPSLLQVTFASHQPLLSPSSLQYRCFFSRCLEILSLHRDARQGQHVIEKTFQARNAVTVAQSSARIDAFITGE